MNLEMNMALELVKEAEGFSAKKYLRPAEIKGYTSKYKGVHMMKNGKFRAKISGKHIGCFDDEEDEAKAYNDYVIKNKTYHSLNVTTKE